ncbi:MAG: response regulator [Ktedonobacterales bacterium]|nr:response regulator [Ktedonobacterales bacterium]
MQPQFDVLIVDDDAAIRETLRALFEDDGYFVREAADGLTALHFLHTVNRPQVVITDYQMPRMDGFGLIGYVALDEDLRTRNRFICLTANAHRISQQFGTTLRNLHVPVINKPFDIEDVINAVDAAAAQLTCPREQFPKHHWREPLPQNQAFSSPHGQ